MMERTANDSGVAHVFGVVTQVKRRWRLARALRGAAIVIGALLAMVIAVALILPAVGYAPGAVIAARIMTALITLVLLARYVVLPLLPRPRDEQVALYVEEHEPSLEGSFVSAIEVSKGASAQHPASPNAIASLVRRMAIERIRAIDGGRHVDARGMRGAGAGLLAVGAIFALVAVFGSEWLGAGMRALLPWERADAVNPYRVDVAPGDATIPRGASVVVIASPVGFQADGVELLVRTSDSTEWTRITMSADSLSRFSARLLDVSAATQYLVETTGMRSRVYQLNVANLPYAKRLDLEYRYPAYTGLPVQRMDSTGDIAAPAGTVVRVRVTPTVATPGGRLVVENGDTLKLEPTGDGTLAALVRVRKPSFYRVELEGPNGDLLTASLSYSIDVLPDRPPTVRFVKPGRDARVLAVDEVYSEARAEDDYGVARLDLVYSVNGADERTLPLHRATSRVIRDVAAGHTFMLEEYALQPGDVISYYARATDNNAVSGAQTTTSDIYFLQVRPYSQEYRQAQEGGQQGGGGGGEQPGQLSQRQREIIAGTFNSSRDSASTDRKALEEDMATLRLSQQRLREDVEQLARRLVERGVAAEDSTLAKIAQILPIAAAAMDTAERALGSGRLRGALQPEQKALQQLQRAEAEFRRISVSMGEQAGGGGGGGGQPQTEDLADLFELQRERLGNQYETLQRGQADEEQQQNEQVDATAERLRQLAARQQQENERARRKADSLARVGASGANSGDAQRRLAQETEQTARQLERLARERESQSLAEAARKMNEAADAMRRSAASGGQRGAEEAAAAMDRLRDARRALDAERGNRTQRAVDEAAQTGRRLAEQQERVAQDVARAANAQGQQREDLQDAIISRKTAMADTTRALARRLDRASLDTRRENPETARQLAEASDTLKQRRIEDKLRITAGMVRDISPEHQNSNERVIANDLAELNEQLEEARAAARSGRTTADSSRRNADALDRARDLVRGMESLDERMRQQQEQRAGAQPGAQTPGGQQPGAQPGSEARGGQQPGGQPGSEARGGQQGGGGAPRGGQAGRETRERLNDARALRRELAGRGVDLSQLDRAIGRLERLGSATDERAAEDLRAQVIEGLRSFEYQLGRFADKGERILVERAGEVPPEYRKYVEEYYRSLGRTKPK
jgi:hypothetical protein